MKKLLQLIACIPFAAAYLTSCHSVPDTPAASDKYRIVWTEDPTTSATLIWDQLQEGSATVYYGTQDHGQKFWKYEHQATPYREMDKYEMQNTYCRLTGLLPDRAYYFVIMDEYGVSERYWFRTAPDTPKPFTCIVGGDTKSDDEPLEAGRSSNRLVSKLRPLFVVFNGDFTSGDGTNPDRWKRWLTDWQELATTGDKRIIPIVPVHGNHENGDHGNLHYIFDAPYHQNDSTRIYYSVSLGGDLFHFIALNSEIDEGGHQRSWLQKDLKDHQHFTFLAAGYHKPFFPHTQRKRENEHQYRQWAFLFDEYGLDISFDGDSHMHKITYPVRPDTVSEDSFQGFVRDDKKGAMYLGEGSWGAHPRINDDDKPWTLSSGSFNQIKWVHVYPETTEVPAHIRIHTVITATYDSEERLSTHHEEVQSLNEGDVFSIPEGISLYPVPGGRNYVEYPYHADAR